MTALHWEIATFVAAAHWADHLVGDLSAPAWDGPGIGGWDMRALVGHTSRALLTVEQYLAMPAETEDVGSAEAYYEQVARTPVADADAVLRRGIEAGEALGQDAAAGFGAIVERVAALLPEVQDRLISTLAGGIMLSNYLPTRTFELVVHGLDIARAAGLPFDPPEGALRRTLDLAMSLAVRSGEGARLLAALTGRGELTRGFSVLP